MKVWKRNAVVATVLVLICAGIHLNWEANQSTAVDLTQTLNAEQVLSDAVQIPDDVLNSEPVMETEDYFSQIRMSRQQSRDGAVELLQETMAYDESSDTAVAASASLDQIVNTALAESQIESLVFAQGYRDCVAYMGDDTISVAVSVPEEGLAEAEVALISDIITSQTDYELAEIRIIEVK